PFELDKQIDIARRVVTGTCQDSSIYHFTRLFAPLEDRVKCPDEPLTHNILYIGVTIIIGSVLAQNHLFWQLMHPPVLFLLSLNHFLPKTLRNVSSYLGSLEEAHFPPFAEKHEITNAHSAMTWERARNATQNGGDTLSSSVMRLVGKVGRRLLVCSCARY
ncbi:hypothetical protein C8Q74DRAFT_1387515, partial [Fomes fomentarius]